MSEELKMKGYIKNGGEKFGIYEFINIGATTISELKKYKFVPNKEYGEYKNLKPDALLVDRRNKSNVKVIAVIEGKNSNKFDSEEKRQIAIKQCNTYCQLFECKIGIATDTEEFLWINSSLDNTCEEKQVYIDEKGKERSYSFILNDDGYILSQVFPLNNQSNTEVGKMMKLISRIVQEISSTNTRLKVSEKMNPNNLARNVWQSIWLASGENPDKCLATFVEIFIFRYLSDLGILVKNDKYTAIDYNSVIGAGKDGCLIYYYTNVRDYIKKLFPAGDDSTSIINGFILDKDIKEHNQLFFNILNSFSEFLKDENGNEQKLIDIEPEFKSRLYEDFLKKSISQKNLGQFFTPRNVVKAIIEMSSIENLQEGSVVGDPACGVGGFLLEPLITKRSSDYYFDNTTNELKAKLRYEGYDRDKKVIIMAKANMLIYLSDLLKDNSVLTDKFADRLNEVFKSVSSSILGSLSITKENYYDLIMSNPPYVTKGISNYKDVLYDKEGQLGDYYKVNGMGVESFFMEKMIKELKYKGKMFVVVPHGLLDRLNDKNIREFIRKECIINAIISLPPGTFYTTHKKTYILALTRKEKDKSHIEQIEPVFSYIVTTTGETLDAYREKTPDKNDLKDMVKQYKYFMSDKNEYESNSTKCKLLDISKFSPDTNWCIDNWWSEEEKIEIGIEEQINIVTIDEYKESVKQTIIDMQNKVVDIDNINKDISKAEIDNEEILISDLFDIKQGNGFYTLKRIKENKWHGDIDVISSNTKDNGVLGRIDKSKILDKDKYYEYCLTWAVDGTSAGKLFVRNRENVNNERKDEFLFTINNHAGILIPKERLEFYFKWFKQNKYKELSLRNIFEDIEEAVKRLNSESTAMMNIIVKKLISSDIVIEISNRSDTFYKNIDNSIEQFVSLNDKLSKADKKKLTKLVKDLLSSDVQELFDNFNEDLKNHCKIILEIINETDIDLKLSSEGDELVALISMIINKVEILESKDIDYADLLKEKISSYLSIDDIRCIECELIPLIKMIYSRKIQIDLEYIKDNIQPIFFQRTRSFNNKKLGTNQIEDLDIHIPITKDGIFDVVKMKEISNERAKLNSIRKELDKLYSDIAEMQVIFE